MTLAPAGTQHEVEREGIVACEPADCAFGALDDGCEIGRGAGDHAAVYRFEGADLVIERSDGDGLCDAFDGLPERTRWRRE